MSACAHALSDQPLVLKRGEVLVAGPMRDNPFPDLELRTFGPPTARVDGREPPADVLWRKHLGLLVYLALSPNGSRSRDHLLGLFWPEKPEARARHSLNEALRRLRSRLGAERILTSGNTIRLNSAGMTCDAVKWKGLRQEERVNVVDSMRGGFLEGLVLDESVAFEDWVMAERHRFRAQMCETLVARGEKALAENVIEKAQASAQAALSLDPLLEAGVSLAMRAAALAGEQRVALAAFSAFKESLRREMGQEPSDGLSSVAERIRAGKWRDNARADWEREPLLVGRPASHRIAFELVDRGVRGNARCLVVTGGQGLGKTRLVDECGARLRLGGALVYAARPMEMDHDAPFSTLRQIFAAGLAGAPGVAGTDCAALSALAFHVPALAEKVRPMEPRDTAQITSGVVSLLRSVAEDAPVGLLLDDVQWADQRTLSVLAGAMRQLGEARVVIILAAESAFLGTQPELVKLLGRLGRDIPGHEVTLEPLDGEDLSALAAQMVTWHDDQDDLDRLTRRLAYETGGNPLLAVTLLRGLATASALQDDLFQWPTPQATYDGPLPFSIPEFVRTAMLAQIGAVDKTAQEVLKAASITSRVIDTDLVVALTDLPGDRVQTALDQLEEHRLVSFDGRRYVFINQLLLRIVQSECLTYGKRRRLGRLAARWLRDRTDLTDRLQRIELVARYEPSHEGYEEALRIAEAAEQVGSPRSMKRALRAADDIVSTCDDIDPTRALELRARLDDGALH